ncbi:MAG TPA: glycoside hydrolase family 3 N-terminal domain-containing protein [Amycolatopsis sp.]|uniref:glycoside hydrolase family 3 N-terminal domain-containing protein n=1 Tax=Amycolatopsis sp. TaxID=37632 RepID=UPI002B4A099C|nr:glycoside hydrolase family 3 N-terminal domain-containing protein [Amycolatopsis sp.]HKS46531.1 glycoside hydrolase family 3 N-terminal domain-containing protein [Amycolatopsis sp.]
MGALLGWVLAALLAATCTMPGNPHAAALTPRQLAGERVIYSYASLTPPQSLLDRIRAGEAAGVIFFKDNISSTTQIASVIQQLKQANAASPVRAPLLLMTDQEGGQVRRLPGEPALSEKQVGQAADPRAAATRAGTGAGQNLASVGMNVNLAPVLDVYRTEGDFMDQFGRSYSKDPAAVSDLGKAFLTAQQQVGVAATAKHFPGLGSAATGQNTDTQPVTLNVPLSTLRSVDEAPYPAAIGAGAKLIMVSWATYPALDAAHPAGLSPAVVRQELRQRLGYDGVTITDALEAASLQAFGTTGQRAVSAASAGMDLILCSARDPSQGSDAVAALASVYQSGQLDQADFTAAADRVSTLRSSLP